MDEEKEDREKRKGNRLKMDGYFYFVFVFTADCT